MEHDLSHHGDREVSDELVDLAVNVRMSQPPRWLHDELLRSLGDIARYPDTSAAVSAIAARHGRSRAEVLPTAGAAEAFTLLAGTLRPRCAAVVHPQFTEPEAALRAAGHDVHRVQLAREDGFTLRPELVPEQADVVFVGNPTNPTSVLHPARSVRELCRPGRVVVVDEAFSDAVAGEPESLAATSLPGVAVVRSLTKTWGIAGLRAGYLLAEPELIGRLGRRQPPWSVSTPATAAMVACCGQEAVAIGDALAEQGARERKVLVDGLRALGVELASVPSAPFVLVRVPNGAGVRERLRSAGYAVRRGDTFPGLSSDWLRIAVRDESTSQGFLCALRHALAVG